MEDSALQNKNRHQTIIKYNLISIVINLFLSIGKIIVGVLTKAHAVILDGIEGLSDLVSSIFTIFSVKIGEKKADSTHPFGYGRIEYLVSMLITIIILLVGLRSIVESVKEILDPHDSPAYNSTVVVIMVVSLVLKLLLGLVLRKKGHELDSSALVMLGIDTMGDAFTSVAILAAIIIKKIFDIDIEHYLCIVISIMIIFTGVQMLKSSIDKILGSSVDPEFKKRVKNAIIAEDGVNNVSTLVIHNYGEGVYVGSVDIEVDEDMRAADITKLSRKIMARADELGMTLTAVGIVGTKTNSQAADRIWDTILDIVREHDDIQKAHSFTVDLQEKQLSFSVVQNIDDPDKEAHLRDLQNEIQRRFPDMTINIHPVKEI